MTQQQATVTRTYKGSAGLKDYAIEAASLAQNGYTVVSEIKRPGGRTKAASLLMFLGVTFLVAGLFVFLPLVAGGLICLVIGLVSGRSPDELTVIWRQADAAPAAIASPANHLATLGDLAQLRDRGAITDGEYEAKKADLLGRV